MPYPKYVKSALVSSSGCAGACRKVPDTVSLRNAQTERNVPSVRRQRCCEKVIPVLGMHSNIRPGPTAINAEANYSQIAPRYHLLTRRHLGARPAVATTSPVRATTFPPEATTFPIGATTVREWCSEIDITHFFNRAH